MKNMASRPKFARAAWVFTVVLILMCSQTLLAQSGRGTLTGTITDNTGAVVPGAQVTITNVATQSKVDQPSNGAGAYLFPALSPGVFDLTVSAQGFKEYIQRGITVTVGDTVTANVALAVG